jgi:hypothetical protein
MEDSRTPIVTAPLDLILSNVGDAAITFADTTNIAADKYAKDLSFIEYPFVNQNLAVIAKLLINLIIHFSIYKPQSMKYLWQISKNQFNLAA